MCVCVCPCVLAIYSGGPLQHHHVDQNKQDYKINMHHNLVLFLGVKNACTQLRSYT